jgi:hypothetical protein
VAAQYGEIHSHGIQKAVVMFSTGHGVLSVESPGSVDKTHFTRLSSLSHACSIIPSSAWSPAEGCGEGTPGVWVEIQTIVVGWMVVCYDV